MGGGGGDQNLHEFRKIKTAMNFVLQLQKKSCKTRSCEGGGGSMLNGQRTSSGNVIWGRGSEAGDGGCLRF